MKLIAVGLATLAFTGVAPVRWRTFHAQGVTVRYPPGWVATSAPLTAVTSPRQILALASYPFPHSRSGADGCEPKQALAALPAGGAFIYGWEYGQVSARLGIRPSEFPPRPAHFTLPGRTSSECLGPGPVYMLRFSDAGRAFQIQVAVGSNLSAATRATVLRVLDSFRASR